MLFFKDRTQKIDYNRLPKHIAIIMDGNGRWAKKRGLSRSIGHREGSNNLRKIVEKCSEIGIKYLTVYAFSTEKEIKDKEIKLNSIDRWDNLPEHIKKEIERVESNTRARTGLCFNIALNYGGRTEIVDAFKVLYKDIIEHKINIDSIDEDIINNSLYTKGICDPDLVIRTSGEVRVSNFLIWQTAYSEFIFSDLLWPDFGKNELEKAIILYQNRNRRYGGVW